MRNILKGTLGLCALSILCHAASADLVYRVALDTSSLVGHPAGPFSLFVEFVDGNGFGDANNAVTISNVAFDGGSTLGGSAAFGGVTGSLETGLAITDSSFVNAFNESFAPGLSLSFTLSLTTNVDALGIPDRLTVSILDRSGVPLPTLAPAGDYFLGVDIGSGGPVFDVWGADTTRSPAAGGGPISFGPPTSLPVATTVLTTSSNPIGVSLPLTLTAVVTPVPPSGKVTFYDRTTVLGTGTLDATGKASISTIALLPGGHVLRARFEPENGYSFSESPPLVQEVSSGTSNGFTLGQSGKFTGEAANNTMVTADFNGDGKMDFAVGLQSGGIAVYLGNGDGTFQAPALYSGLPVVSLAAGDLRGTGWQDIVAVSYSPSSRAGQTYINRYWNNGNGTFQRGPDMPPPQSTPGCSGSGCAAIAIADMNGDGRPDLVYLAAGSPAGSLSVFLGNGDGTFQNVATTALGYQVNLADLVITDFNRDGRIDIAFLGFIAGSGGNPDTTPIVVMLGNGDSTFQAPTALANDYAPGSPLVTADFNRDGNPDLALSVYTAGSWSIEVLMGNGDGTFQTPLQTALGFSIQNGWLVAADVNGDTIPDLTTASGANTVYVLNGKGDGTFQTPASFAAPGLNGPATNGAVAALNHTGQMDIITLGGTAKATYLQVLLGIKAAPGH